MNADAGPALSVSGLHKAFRNGPHQVQALAGVDIQVQRAQITGLIGPDGAGKTTLLRLLAGLLRADAGELQVLGIDVQADPLAVQRAIGYMPQHFGLYEDLSVSENLDLYADLQGLPRAARAKRYPQLLQMTGLSAFTTRLTGQLSGGMKQKLGLACTLVRPPQLLLLDEPTVGVDPLSRRELWKIIDHLVANEGLTVVLSTTYLDEAERCAEVLLLHAGQVLGHGPPGKFGQPLQGRCWLVRVGSEETPRRLQAALAARPEVLDAVIAHEGIRVLLQAGVTRPTALDHDWQPSEPRFEDAFIEMLPARRQQAEVRSKQAPAARTDHSEAVISVQGLSRRFGDFYAVHDVSFEVHRGEIFGLLGANGAGKSTTFRMLCGLLPASSGQLAVSGVDLRRAAATARARIGYMAQRFSLYTHLKVRQNLTFFARSYGLRGPRLRARLHWAAESFGLHDRLDAISGDLPLGYKQRLAMACALMHEPDILFLDEPTSGVDPLERRSFWERINALANHGVTIMVTTHLLEEAEYCDRLLILAQGRILAEGSPRAIRAQAATPEQPDPDMEEAFITLIGATAEVRHAA